MIGRNIFRSNHAAYSCPKFSVHSDQNEDDINNTRALKRKHVLPLPVNTSEGNKWGARYANCCFAPYVFDHH
jgi:hypothetical protein